MATNSSRTAPKLGAIEDGKSATLKPGLLASPPYGLSPKERIDAIDKTDDSANNPKFMQRVWNHCSDDPRINL